VKRLSIQITDDQHKALLAKVADKNLETIAEFIRQSITNFNPKKMKKVVKKVVAKKVAKKKVSKKAIKKAVKKVFKKSKKVSKKK